jgi:hypothetical protein
MINWFLPMNGVHLPAFKTVFLTKPGAVRPVLKIARRLDTAWFVSMTF